MVLRGLLVAHASPSVADNRAVAVVGPDARLSVVDCHITSQTGAGVVVEGGEAMLANAAIGPVAGVGILVADDLESGEPGRARLDGATVVQNCGREGVAAVGSARVSLAGTTRIEGGRGGAVRAARGTLVERGALVVVTGRVDGDVGVVEGVPQACPMKLPTYAGGE